MTNDNKFVPSTPKTYEVRYSENKQLKLSSAARAKVIKRSGSNYLSENQEGYGPMPNEGCNPNRFKSKLTVKLSLTGGFSFKQGEVCFGSCEISGQGNGNVQSWKQKVENGEIKIVNSSNERDDKCVEKESSLKSNLENALSDWEKNKDDLNDKGLDRVCSYTF